MNNLSALTKTLEAVQEQVTAMKSKKTGTKRRSQPSELGGKDADGSSDEGGRHIGCRQGKKMRAMVEETDAQWNIFNGSLPRLLDSWAKLPADFAAEVLNHWNKEAYPMKVMNKVLRHGSPSQSQLVNEMRAFVRC